jgi:hypothetical protein
VKLAIKKLRNTRSPGPSNINAELIKVDEPELTDKLYKIMTKAWRIEKSSSCVGGRSCLPNTQGRRPAGASEPSGYITSLNTASQICSNILYDGLLPHVESITDNYQSGFGTGRSTTNQTQAIRQILEKTRQHKLPTIVSEEIHY